MYKKLFCKYLKKSILFVTVMAVSLGLALIPGESSALADPPEPYLVKDILPGGNGSEPRFFVDSNGMAFFKADDGVHSNWEAGELWKSDGTEVGTVLVKDINHGSEGSGPHELTDVNGIFFFSANDGTHGYELWKSDGTEAGTMFVKDINPGSDNSNLHHLTNVNGTLFFFADDGTHGYELWKSDGTEAGTVLVKDINPDSGSSYIEDIRISMDSTLFFSADDGIHGKELWKSDGTETGTVMVKDIFPGDTGSIPLFDDELTNVDGTLFFTARDDVHGFELWKSDGTETGTVMVKDIKGGVESSTLFYLTDVNGTLFFENAEEYELWKSDGSEAGTIKVKGGINIKALINVNGTLFMDADDGTHGYELWKSDGTESGTVLVKDIFPGVNHTFYPGEVISWNNIDDTLFFGADDGVHGIELWTSDGTETGTVLVKDINPGDYDSNPNYLTNVNGDLFFQAGESDHGEELWVLSVPEKISIFLPLIIR